MTLVLEALRGDQTLDPGSLGVRLGTLLLGGNLTANDELANVVLLGEVEELADVCTLHKDAIKCEPKLEPKHPVHISIFIGL